MIRVDLVYARPERQLTVTLQLAAGSSVSQAIAASGLLVQCP
ncbi:MAG: RnfH family protein, partial [Candidatus Competibacteraceae bacterium]|nr:RnfH family protein [Candidatus Competibacteraceae bacterium]